jgi:outer membrane protein OmpA-like peptidoglycan-associated protein/CheY-like chemotaxis protein
MNAPISGVQHVLCVLSEAQKQALALDLDRYRSSGVEVVFQESPERALEQVGELKPPLVLVGMSLEGMEGLEFLALLMRRHADFPGKVVVLPDEGDPFPPMAQYRNASTGKSVTEETTLAQVLSWIEALAPAPAPRIPTPLPAAAAPARPRPPIPPRPIAKPPRAISVGAVEPPVPLVAPADPEPPPPPPAPAAPPPAAVELEPPAAETAAGAVDAVPPARLDAAGPQAPLAVARSQEAHPPAPAAASFRPIAASPLIARVGRRKLLLFAALAALAIAGLLAVVFARAQSPSEQTAPTAPPRATASALPRAPVSVPAPAPSPPQPEPAEDFAELTTLPLRFDRTSTQGLVSVPGQLDAIAEKLASALKARPAARLEVGGHTSQEGPEYLHGKLGEQRAIDAKRRLVERGIAEHRIVLKNYAASRPLQGAGGGDDLDESRRVTVRLLD